MAYDDDLARDLAAEAGRRLLALRAQGGDPDELRQAGDRLSHEFLAGEFARLRPGDAVLSEEGRDDPARLTAGRVWIVDPLDGTREFGEAGRTDWAVHIALWDHGALTAGAVALPAQGKVLSTAEAPRPAAGEPGGTLRLVVSRTRPPAFAQRLSAAGGLTLLPLGSAGAKAAPLSAGRPTSTRTAAASTNGIPRRRWRWPSPPGCTRPGSMVRSWSTTRLTRRCRIS